nr:hypothetical protein [uncultured Pseudomonas sp.]
MKTKSGRAINGRYRLLGISLLILIFMLTLRWITYALSDDPEIALTLAEPWEDMRQRSSAKIAPAIANEIWFRVPKSDARLRFIDPKYGFVTPLARFFTIGFINGKVRNIRMSPQVEPLLLDDALKVVVDLQNQWKRGGWYLIFPKTEPAIVNTMEWQAKLRDSNKGGRTFWQAEEKYQVMLALNRFKDKKRPSEERYMITLAVGKPWVPHGEE